MKTVRKSVIGCILFFIAIGISFYLFALRIDHLVNLDLGKRLVESVDNNAKNVRSMFERDLRYLSALSEQLSQSSTVPAREAILSFQTFAHTAGYTRLAVDQPSGISYTSDGDRQDMSHMEYLQKVLAGSTAISRVYQSPVDGMACISIAVPLYREDSVAGALRGVYLSSALEKQLNGSFNGAGYYNLVDSMGNFLFKSPALAHLYSGDNLIQVLRETATFGDGYSADRLQRDLSVHHSGFTVYTLEDTERCGPLGGYHRGTRGQTPLRARGPVPGGYGPGCRTLL